jgi:hypothetical protein
MEPLVLLTSLGYACLHVVPLLGLFQAMIGVSYILSYTSASVIADELRLNGSAAVGRSAPRVVTNAIATTLAEYAAGHSDGAA